MARFKSLQSRKKYAAPTKINIPTPQKQLEDRARYHFLSRAHYL